MIFIFSISCNIKRAKDGVLTGLTKADSLHTKLIGEWGSLGEDNPVWEFKQDSIYYFDRKQSYPYKIIGNDIIIELPESEGHLRNMSVIKDTMTFYDTPGMPIKGYRFKQKSKPN